LGLILGWVGLHYGGKPLSITLPLSSAGTQTSLVTCEKLSGKLRTNPCSQDLSPLPPAFLYNQASLAKFHIDKKPYYIPSSMCGQDELKLVL